jgi:hypothetical protein
MDAVAIFAGPSPSRAVLDTARRAGANVHPPARFGDILRVRSEGVRTVLLIDGLYWNDRPVRHKELLQLIDSGISVIGAASMGALRAAELNRYGMIDSCRASSPAMMKSRWSTQARTRDTCR